MRVGSFSALDYDYDDDEEEDEEQKKRPDFGAAFFGEQSQFDQALARVRDSRKPRLRMSRNNGE